ncbi:type II secretion system minor pseudopilin GspK [Polynucleobacter sp. AP-Melu-500A-A1]|uniref:type II secretion system minor pseudopilin GspK n=1 Tax=Polynucleobacter sp. AP-Melu-500A-A1 TaxID=2576929 RepID=UPI001C0D40FF|nr:type II secretion system minor pseudopilin GspK [Polynucleobacter sp. AP-Melu-500A-A1]MBU3630714.1 type II secretion system minor pseudopilin GspK [Polynucleobacter sp. AP-Melu-500A-A1]
MPHHRYPLRRQSDHGSATVTALIVVGVAAIIIASLMWRQQLQIRNIETARGRMQVQWLQHGMIDFARLVLTQDQRTSTSDHLGEAWALPLSDSKVADFLKNVDIPDELQSVSVNGGITDAQGLFNLTNLWNTNLQINPNGVLEYSRLLNVLGFNPNLAQLTAQAVQEKQMVIQEIHDLIGIPGYDASTIRVLRSFVTVLPNNTTINVNTAPAEVLMAAFTGLSRSSANAIVQNRSNSPAKTLEDINSLLTRSGAGTNVTIDASLVNVNSQFWLASTEVKLGSGIFKSTSLIQRSPSPMALGNYTQVVWNRTNRILSE